MASAASSRHVGVTLKCMEISISSDTPALQNEIVDGAMIGGEWLSTDGRERVVIDPADGRTLAIVHDASPALVDKAVVAARNAFESWQDTPLTQRVAALEAVADALAANAEQLARIETIDTGKPLSQSVSDIRIGERYFRYYAHAAQHFFGDSIPIGPAMHAYTRREPYGIVAHITPWNAPISQLTRGVAPSLAVGNTVVVKPSELAPLSSLVFAEIVREILPPGVFNLVPGDGIHTGHALSSHPDIDHLTFTGSVATGTAVSTAASANIVATNLELGGKSPAIVFPDGDLDAAVTSATGALIRNSGQSCSALSRFIVHHDVVDEFSTKLAARVEALSIGPGIDDPDVGPLVSAEQRDRVLGLIRRAIGEGVIALTGGSELLVVAGHENGYFARPTVLKGVTAAMEIAQTEVFGPVQTIIAFETEAEALAIANGTEYGLVSAIFTTNIDVASRLSAKLRAGQVQINGFVGAGAEIPFGGYKHSGHGREKGFDALYGYSQVKAVVTHVAAL